MHRREELTILVSKYTTEIRFICEMAIPLWEQGDFTDIDRAIEAGRKQIFTFNYNLFDPLYKPVIETKFLRHFYTREIGQETLALWKLKLRDKWEMKLPYYNKLWESELLRFNPLYDVDYEIINTGDRFSKRSDNSLSEGSSNVNSTGQVDSVNKGSRSDEAESTDNSNHINKFSDTPQGGLDGVIETEWLTTATEDINTDNAKNKSTSSSIDDNKTHSVNESNGTDMRKIANVGNIHDIDDYQKHVVGKMGTRSYPNMLIDWRKSFLNIDEMFINEMNDLFMQVY